MRLNDGILKEMFENLILKQIIIIKIIMTNEKKSQQIKFYCSHGN